MTLEGHDPGADDTPAPPARTRWSEDAADEEDVLLPPYVPGARPEPPSPRADTGRAPAPSEEEASEEGAGPDGDPWAGEEVALPEPEPTAAPAAEEATADYPWEPEGATEDMPGGPELLDIGSYGDSYGSPDAPLEDDSALYDAYDLGEGTEVPATLPALGGGYEGPDVSALPALEDASGPEHAAAAERLERLAEVLRTEGRAGIERELASRDRLTSLLAGVVAGYLAGLED